MNKTRLFGILIVIIGIVLMNVIENDLSSFIGGILIGLGIALSLTGKSIFTKKT